VDPLSARVLDEMPDCASWIASASANVSRLMPHQTSLRPCGASGALRPRRGCGAVDAAPVRTEAVRRRTLVCGHAYRASN
jgi:hypothetical protein